jgi:hypothetical protein
MRQNRALISIDMSHCNARLIDQVGMFIPQAEEHGRRREAPQITKANLDKPGLQPGQRKLFA